MLAKQITIPTPMPTSARSSQNELTGLVDDAHNTDCISLLQSMPDDSVQMVFADPPFNLGKKYNSYSDNLPFAEYMEWTKKWLVESCRVLKNDGSVFVYNIPKLLIPTANLLNQHAKFRHWIAWNANGQPLGKSLQPAHYGILFYTKSQRSKFYNVRAPHKTCRACKEFIKDYGGKKHLRHEFGYQISDVWDDIHRVRHNSKRIDMHPCQLPVHLIERLMLMTTDENDIVFDPFCGGGSAAVATKQMGRHYIGADIDTGYCNATREKFRAASATKLGGAFVSMHLNKVASVRDIDLPIL